MHTETVMLLLQAYLNHLDSSDILHLANEKEELRVKVFKAAFIELAEV